jgi:hypothetical protein
MTVLLEQLSVMKYIGFGFFLNEPRALDKVLMSANNDLNLSPKEHLFTVRYNM